MDTRLIQSKVRLLGSARLSLAPRVHGTAALVHATPILACSRIYVLYSVRYSTFGTAPVKWCFKYKSSSIRAGLCKEIDLTPFQQIIACSCCYAPRPGHVWLHGQVQRASPVAPQSG